MNIRELTVNEIAAVSGGGDDEEEIDEIVVVGTKVDSGMEDWIVINNGTSVYEIDYNNFTRIYERTGPSQYRQKRPLSDVTVEASPRRGSNGQIIWRRTYTEHYTV